MTRTLAAALALAIAACASPDRPVPPASGDPATPPASDTSAGPPASSAPLAPAPGTSRAASGTPSPSASSPPDPRSPEAAVEVVRAYYAALAARDHRRAYALWGGDGRASGQTFEAFAGGFAETARVRVDAGPASEPEGAAGSVFVTVPVVVHARTTSGAAQTFHGSYVLRRTGDVPGASAAQRHWHIASADLHADA